ncbi:hypothetical protein [Prosthecobacter algae]|uniref:hypothetical protein n=1 Tax=Prosthecobacter algae TaxID=1144682 RepID=UPI003CD057A9
MHPEKECAIHTIIGKTRQTFRILLDLPFLAMMRLMHVQMKRLWQILALILLALMVPASMCCLVPSAGI